MKSKKQINNIFSKEKKIITPRPNSDTPIIMDTREKQSLIAANLLEQKANISFEKLEVGDYLIQGTIIERKTFQDNPFDFVERSIALDQTTANWREAEIVEKPFLSMQSAIEKVELFKRSLFNVLIGNEDMHTKNFSLITRKGKTTLAPAYDFLSTTSTLLTMGVSPREIEETAITLNGKKRNLSAKLWIDYFGKERLRLPEKTIDKQLGILRAAYPRWQETIGVSFLPNEQKEIFSNLLEERADRLGIV